MTDRIEELFGELRAHDRAHAASFDDIMKRATPPPAHGRRLTGAAITIAVAAGIALLVFWPRHMPHDPAAPTITGWRAPTDALLEVPGRELLTEMPDLDQSVLDIGGMP